MMLFSCRLWRESSEMDEVLYMNVNGSIFGDMGIVGVWDGG